MTAGLAFALQRVVTALAGYFVILRGQTFNVGDRITMGGVRGDVIALGFIQTTIMEMGQPPAVQNADPAMWVRGRQYSGRVVTVTNAKIFDEPVYNYTRDFPYIWDELVLPIAYSADRGRAERILQEVAERHTVRIEQMSDESLREMQRRYFMKPAEMKPKVYYRLTDNWLELTVRFIAEDRGVRDLKDAMSRDILKALDEAGIGIASATFEIVGPAPSPRPGRPRRPWLITTSRARSDSGVRLTVSRVGLPGADRRATTRDFRNARTCCRRLGGSPKYRVAASFPSPPCRAIAWSSVSARPSCK